jgi:hypothetical protein
VKRETEREGGGKSSKERTVKREGNRKRVTEREGEGNRKREGERERERERESNSNTVKVHCYPKRNLGTQTQNTA